MRGAAIGPTERDIQPEWALPIAEAPEAVQTWEEIPNTTTMDT